MLATPVPVPVHAAATVVTRIAVVAPSRVKAGRAFTASADARLDKRQHKPPYDYLKAALLYKAGSDAACPASVPLDRKGWSTAATYEYEASGSVVVEFSGRVTLRKAGATRLCAYVYVERPSRKIGVFTSTLSVKARASKRVRAS